MSATEDHGALEAHEQKIRVLSLNLLADGLTCGAEGADTQGEVAAGGGRPR